MNFWFCETCGKRLTEKDLEEGAARNKKLKGVYCQQCSVGVMTMEMDAINIAQLANEQPRSAPASDSNRSATPSRKGSSVIRMQAAAQRHFPTRTAPPSGVEKLSTLLVIGAALVAGGVITLAIVRDQDGARNQPSAVVSPPTPQPQTPQVSPPTVLPAASLPARQSQISSVPVASSEIAQPVKPAPFPLDTNSNGSSPKPPDNGPAAPTEVILSLRGDLKLELVLINAGEFEMGSNGGEPDERPAHKVKLSRSFYMGRFEVTQAQFEKMMGKNPSMFKGENLPVESVTYADTQEFCKRVSRINGKLVRLPTEAEWEFACRGAKGANTGESDTAFAEVGWFRVNSDSKTHPVGQKRPNALGLFDLQGNVSEWCQDWYEGDYYSKTPTDDPQGSPQGTDRVIRGGSWDRDPVNCGPARRNKAQPLLRNQHTGFRVVLQSGTP
jgi:formylglycine-generating enzyme required for sulfatase activity